MERKTQLVNKQIAEVKSPRDQADPLKDKSAEVSHADSVRKNHEGHHNT